MSNSGFDIPWTLIESPDPSGADVTDISGVARKWTDIPYDVKSPSQILDIYLPACGDGPFPTYVFLHGGAFIAGDKQDLQFLMAADGINRGYAVVSVEYRKGFEAKAPNALYDVKAALRFLKANAEKYCLDPDRIAVGGDSAGAYYAVFAAATEGIRAFDGPDPILPDVSVRVKAVVAQCGCYDLMSLTPPPEVEAAAPKEFVPGTVPANLMTIFVGANLHYFPDVAKLLNPITYITADFPPTLIQVGSADQFVPCTESESLAKAIAERCGQDRVRYQVFDGWNHCALNHIVTKDWFMSENMDRVFGFLDGVL